LSAPGIYSRTLGGFDTLSMMKRPHPHSETETPIERLRNLYFKNALSVILTIM